MDNASFIFMFLVIFISICVVVSIGGAFIDAIGREKLEDVVIECVIIHKDIDNTPFFTVIKTDSDFSATISVSHTEYAQYEEGDVCTVLQKGYHYPLGGNQYTYEIIK